MNHVPLLSEGDEVLELTKAVLLYESKRGGAYATVHPMEADAQQPGRSIIGAGTPLTVESLAAFAQSAAATTTYSGFVPDNLLYTAPNMIAWWAPAAQRQAWFKTGSSEIGTAHGEVAHPALVFIVHAKDWYVFALKQSQRPTLETPLNHSPHFNVHADASICAGNVRLPSAPTAAAISEYEDAFYRSHFTHAHRTGVVKYKGGATALWRDQLLNPDSAAMLAALVPAKKTLKSAIEQIAKNHRSAH